MSKRLSRREEVVASSLGALVAYKKFVGECYALGIDMINAPSLENDLIRAIECLYNTFIKDDDMIGWWLYEDVKKVVYKNGKPLVDVTKIEDFVAYLEKTY